MKAPLPFLLSALLFFGALVAGAGSAMAFHEAGTMRLPSDFFTATSRQIALTFASGLAVIALMLAILAGVALA